MRDVPEIWSAWRSGLYVGDTKPCTRVTVETSYLLRTTGPTVGNWNRGPARWYQRADTTKQIETEIPNIESVSISTGLDSDAGTCDISIINTLPSHLQQYETPAGQYGQQGYYTWDRGQTQDTKVRWGHTPNVWNNVLVPNALIRTYMGFGGHDKTLHDALADGNVVLKGVWLVDDVSISSAGSLQLRCRDMAKLLIDQQLYPPLVPSELHPLKYDRYSYKTFPIPADPPGGSGSVCYDSAYGVGPAPHSSVDAVYGQYNADASGHRPADAFDISVDPPGSGPGHIAHQASYWLSEPRSGPSDSVWIEFSPQPDGSAAGVNEIYFHAWAGNYTVRVSVFENGAWVPPEASNQGGMTVDGIPWVGSFSPAWEGGQPPGLNPNTYPLPRDYSATRIRLTVSGLVLAPEGGYRAGARKIFACFNWATAAYPIPSFAAAGMPYNTSNITGYWQVRGDGRVYAFGDARLHDVNSPIKSHQGWVIAMSAHPSGNGYWTMDLSGRVLSYGQAAHYGDLYGVRDDAVDLAPTPTGNGYWLLAKNGTVYSFGDATSHGTATVSGSMPSGSPIIARSIESHPTTPGYWILRSDGNVQAFNLTHYGNANRTGFTVAEYVASIRRTSTGAGYWIVSGGGIVQKFGDAGIAGFVARGTEQNWAAKLCWDLIPSSSGDHGVAVQRTDGNLDVLSGLDTPIIDAFEFFGSTGSGSGMQRYDGNYRDYSDIVRELLLWSGFYFYRNPQPAAERPDVYGNIENTGVYAKDTVPIEWFNKRPPIEAIKQLKGIVGYLFYVDSEGTARFETPNWWQMGNFLSDGTPFSYMPEIDETVQLTSHQITFSAQSARSKITIATQDPLPSLAGGEKPKVTTITEIEPPSKADLRGMISPVTWFNGLFLNPAEQKIMADLIALRIWFQRRTGQFTCVANPLIDINDQVRVIERTTGEVYIHYVRGIQITHDLHSGDFMMNVTTHWMGGTAYGKTSLYMAGASRPQSDGYWQASVFGPIYAFGNAHAYESNEADTHIDWVIGMRSTPSGLGYWTVDTSGKVLSYGDAVNYGSVHSSAKDITDMAVTATGLGYWLLAGDGTVTTFGDAVSHGNATATGNMPSGSPKRAVSIEAHPSISGYWVLVSDGIVQAFNVTHWGDANRVGYDTAEYTSCLRRTVSGNGYWIVSGGGIVQAKGDAPNRGDGVRYPASNRTNGLIWDMLTDSDDGYGLIHADGTIDVFAYAYQGAANLIMIDDVIKWPIVTQDAHDQMVDQTQTIPVSIDVMKFLAGTSSPSAINAIANNFGAPVDPSIKAFTS